MKDVHSVERLRTPVDSLDGRVSSVPEPELAASAIKNVNYHFWWWPPEEITDPMKTRVGIFL